MPAWVWIVLAVLALILGGGWLWRARRWACPPWLVPLLENPLFHAVAGPGKVLGRAGVAAGMHVADLGCGPGRLTLPAAERVGPAGRVLAVDIQPRMLERLEERVRAAGAANVETLCASVGEGKLPRDAFDRALLVTVLGEIRDPVKALREIREALKPGGILSVTEVLPDPHFQSRARVRRLAAEAGLEPVATHGSIVAFTMNLRRPGA